MVSGEKSGCKNFIQDKILQKLLSFFIYLKKVLIKCNSIAQIVFLLILILQKN